MKIVNKHLLWLMKGFIKRWDTPMVFLKKLACFHSNEGHIEALTLEH